MKNSGKKFEQLVKQIEEVFLPQGLSISTNEHVFDDDGHQLAEFDILISGKIGTTSFKWLIECRDRSSDGAAPGSWIEQLVGRRDRFAFNKVTAVSTTGFAEGVKEYAEQKGIELRSVEKLTGNEITDWIKISEADAIVNLGVLHHVTLVANSQTDKNAIQALESTLAKTNASREQQILINTKSGERTSISSFWQKVINASPQMFSGILPNAQPREAEIHINYKDSVDHYQVQTNEGLVDIAQFIFRAKLSVIHSKVPITGITQYSKVLEQDMIAQSAHFKIGVGDKVVDVALHNFGEKDKTLITARLESL